MLYYQRQLQTSHLNPTTSVEKYLINDKSSCNLLPKRVREIEHILFEMSPTNWVIITNRNTKKSTIEGTFDDENVATNKLSY